MRCPFASMKDCCKSKCAIYDAVNEECMVAQLAKSLKNLDGSFAHKKSIKTVKKAVKKAVEDKEV